MILTLDLADPRVQAALGLAALALVLLLRRAWRGPDTGALTLGLAQLAQAQAQSQARLAQGLDTSQTRIAQTFGALHERLGAIDRAQGRIEHLSGQVLGLQDILSNKQARGAWGEIQLAEIVGNALPPDAYTLQATLGTGRRVDCLIHLADPPGPLAIDSKFPLESYEALRAATDDRARDHAARALRAATLKHLRDIAERYIVPGQTADQALMFLPSEAVYAELHANFADVVRQGFALRVWIVSPTTTMAVLTAMRAILRDSAVRAQGARIRAELGLLGQDLGRLAERTAALDRHFAAAADDLAGLRLSSHKIATRAARLDAADWRDAPLGKSGTDG